MGAFSFVVSNPPHQEVDARAAARCFSLTLAEASMKANFRAPEIWMADPDRSVMEAAARRLGEAGLETVILDGGDLLDVPKPALVTSFEFSDTQFVAIVDDGCVEIRNDASVVGVFCKPPADMTRHTRRAATIADGLGRASSAVVIGNLVGGTAGEALEAPENAAFLHIYVNQDDQLRAISVANDVTDFSGLGARRRSLAMDNMVTFVDECDRRFANIHLDRRAENLLPRRRPMIGRPFMHREDRRLFSYGSESLFGLLGSISPQLQELTQYELGSRIGYLIAETRLVG